MKGLIVVSRGESVIGKKPLKVDILICFLAAELNDLLKLSLLDVDDDRKISDVIVDVKMIYVQTHLYRSERFAEPPGNGRDYGSTLGGSYLSSGL
jgi:hypothetical protein